MTPRLLLGTAALILALGGCGDRGGGAGGSPAGKTLATIQARGYVRCGASQSTIGFGAPDDKGYWRGLDVDTCRAIAAAVLGDRDKARFVPLTGQQRLSALQTGEIDVLPRTTTWTLARDANGINFTLPNFYDYTGFMVRRDRGARRAQDLSGASVCIQTGSVSEVTFADVSRRNRLNLHPVVFDTTQATRQAFFSGRCDALITDASALASVKATLAKDSDAYVIFPADDVVEALTPAVRQGDEQWFDIVKASIDAMLVGEQLGLTQGNIDARRRSDDPDVRRFVGAEPGVGSALGLKQDWAYQIVRQVGNYGEIYDRNVGSGSALKIPRGLNRLQRDGGIMLPIPFS
ncbi:MAG: amino acid ABC transporter substrate-binding protein [Sphingomonadaceae bacterium]|nr:amino acid ABC transporter substrate-binding protein [Sphingomonadaceae bacterium]